MLDILKPYVFTFVFFYNVYKFFLIVMVAVFLFNIAVLIDLILSIVFDY